MATTRQSALRSLKDRVPRQARRFDRRLEDEPTRTFQDRPTALECARSLALGVNVPQHQASQMRNQSPPGSFVFEQATPMHPAVMKGNVMTQDTLVVPLASIQTATMAAPAPQMQAVLDQRAGMGAKPLHMLTVQEARVQATPADAVAVLMTEQHIKPGRAAKVLARYIMVPGPAGEIKARVCTPPGMGPLPVVVYDHGGGGIANNDTYDASARSLSLGANAFCCRRITVRLRKTFSPPPMSMPPIFGRLDI